MKKLRKSAALLIGAVLLIVIVIKISPVSFADIYPASFNCYFLNESSILQKVNDINSNTLDFRVVEENVTGIPSEGTNIKFYYDKNTNNLIFVEVNSFATLARYLSKYYLENNEVYFIDSVTDEWVLKKLYGENGELSSSQGEYVVGTSTKEQYLISNNKLCKYIAEKPRIESAAVTKSDPSKDTAGLLEMFQTLRRSEL